MSFRDPEGFPAEMLHQLRQAVPAVRGSVHERIVALTGEVLTLSTPAASEFVRNCSFVLGRTGTSGLEQWCREGLEILRRSEQSGIAYFRLGTGRSSLLVQELSSGVELSGIRSLLEAYCLALTGEQTPVLSAGLSEVYGAGLPLPVEVPIDGHPVFLPDFVDRYPSKLQNFSWYKVMATHQAGHIEFDSYRLVLDGTGRDQDAYSALIDRSPLALEISGIAEDGRIDFLVGQQYRGIARDLGSMQAEALGVRPPLTAYRLRGAFLEALLQMSLGRSGTWLVPAALATPVRLAAMVMKWLLAPGSTVEDSAEATISLHKVACSLPDEPVLTEGWQPVDLDGIPPLPPRELDFAPEGYASERHGEPVYARPPQVEYRASHDQKRQMEDGSPPPQGQDQGATGDSRPVRQTPGNSQDDDFDEVGVLSVEEDNPDDEPFVFGVNTVNRDQTEARLQQQYGNNRDPDEGALEADGPHSYLYDEWDFRASDYRLRWCRVRQMPLLEGSPDFFHATLDAYHELAQVLRRQFELLNPRFSRKAKRLTDGEDFDLDAVVDFVITRKARQSPDGRVYWRRNKTERDVSVAFLLDMSSSTIEYINRTPRGNLAQPVFRDYRDYFEWLQSDNDSLLRPKDFKRIIDLEKESLVLLTRALETIGDTYAIYGFSGYGRENVEFYLIKDLDEELSDQVKSRIDSISPQHGTRMGPAIRHAAWKLEQQPARSKFLFLISDGRPEDHGYGKDGLEREYAANDTRMALVETRRKGITPFCLTVDRTGHEYLGAICTDMGYEVVADIESLPRCLPTLYGRFTT